MGEVDQPHHAEHQRQARGEQRIEPTEQHALDHVLQPAGMLRCRNKRGGSARASVRSGGPVSDRRPS